MVPSSRHGNLHLCCLCSAISCHGKRIATLNTGLQGPAFTTCPRRVHGRRPTHACDILDWWLKVAGGRGWDLVKAATATATATTDNNSTGRHTKHLNDQPDTSGHEETSTCWRTSKKITLRQMAWLERSAWSGDLRPAVRWA